MGVKPGTDVASHPSQPSGEGRLRGSGHRRRYSPTPGLRFVTAIDDAIVEDYAEHLRCRGNPPGDDGVSGPGRPHLPRRWFPPAPGLSSSLGRTENRRRDPLRDPRGRSLVRSRCEPFARPAADEAPTRSTPLNSPSRRGRSAVSGESRRRSDARQQYVQQGASGTCSTS